MSDIASIEIQPAQNSSVIRSRKNSGHTWLKAGFILASTTSTFLLAKTTGVFAWLYKICNFSNNLVATQQGITDATQVNPVNTWLATTDLTSDASSIKAEIVPLTSIAKTSSYQQNLVHFNELALAAPYNEAQNLDPDKKPNHQHLLSQTLPAIGEIFKVVTSNQLSRASAITKLLNQQFVIGYEISAPAANSQGYQNVVYANLYNSDGSLNTSGFEISNLNNIAVDSMAIVSLANGKFLAAWGEYNLESLATGYPYFLNYYRIFNQDATPNGTAVRVNFNGARCHPIVTALENNSFAFAVCDSSAPFALIHYHSDNSYLSLPFFKLSSCSTSGHLISATTLNNGNFVIVWSCFVTNTQNNQYYSIYNGGIYTKNGTAVGNNFGTVDSNTISSNSWRPVVASLSNNKFIVVYGTGRGDCAHLDDQIYAQIYNADGSVSGNSFLVSTTSFAGNSNGYPLVTSLSDDNFVIAFSNCKNINAGGDGQPLGISVQIFNANATPLKPMFYLGNNSVSAYSAISSLPDGKFIIYFNKQAVIYSDRPILLNNALTIVAGQTVTLTSSYLNAVDYLGNNNQALIFTVSNVQHAHFELSTAPGGMILSFSQQQITNGQIKLILDGSNLAPSYMVSVSDGAYSTVPVAANIVFYDAPILLANQITISTGQNIILTTDNLDAYDGEQTAAQLTFIISNMQRCRFERLNAPGIPIMAFSLADLQNSQIKFMQTGGNFAPSYNVAVSDGTTTTPASAASINLITIAPSPAPIVTCTAAPTPEVPVATPVTTAAATPEAITIAATGASTAAPTPGVSAATPVTTAAATPEAITIAATVASTAAPTPGVSAATPATTAAATPEAITIAATVASTAAPTPGVPAATPVTTAAATPGVPVATPAITAAATPAATIALVPTLAITAAPTATLPIATANVTGSPNISTVAPDAAANSAAPIAIVAGSVGGFVVVGAAMLGAYKACRSKPVTVSASTSSGVELQTVSITAVDTDSAISITGLEPRATPSRSAKRLRTKGRRV